MRYRSPYAKDRSNDLREDWTTGSKLERALYDRGIGKEELVRRSGVSRSTVYRILSGDEIGTLATWRKIAAAVGCSVSELLDEGVGDGSKV